jgi:hypothetical protein
MGDIRPDGFDGAREVGAERQRQRLGQGAVAGADPAVPRSDTGCLHLYQHLACTRHRAFDFFWCNCLRRAKGMHSIGCHRLAHCHLLFLGSRLFGFHGRQDAVGAAFR